MKIIHLRSSKIFLVKHNQIPFVKFLNVKYVEEFRKLFRFNDIVSQPDASGEIIAIIFGTGLFTAKDGEEIAVSKLVIEPRKIVCNIEGSSSHLEEIYQITREFLVNLTSNVEEDFLVPVVTANETEIISNLEISPLKLFPTAYIEGVIPNGLSLASYKFAKARLGALQTVFQIDYEETESSILSDSRVNLIRKEFLIQTAIGRSIEEKTFASKAPLISDDHIKFLENLEKVLSA